MIFYLKPNHMIITDEIYVYQGLIFYKDKPNKFYTIIPFSFQIVALLFYFEILEFNFYNLNKNTVRNIKYRERQESEDRNKSIENVIELGDMYYLKYDQLMNYDEYKDKEKE